MHAASRDALAQVTSHLDSALNSTEESVATAAHLGTELFDVVEVLDGDRGLRVAVANASATAEQRTRLVSEVFGGKVSQATLEILKDAVEQTWSTPRELRQGLVEIGRRSLFRAAEQQGMLEKVEDELFCLSRILDREGRLTQLLSDHTAQPAKKRELLANVLYGKVTSLTEALALQVIGRPERNPIDDMAGLADAAAALRNRTVAHVVAAGELNETQESVLAKKLQRIYGKEMSIHSEVDTDLLGGMVIRVGDEVIDGSTSGKLQRLRAHLV
ncbi:F0F1 ATP synthase subunit delta [Corynebacterium poyangense]|uniref:ATP synthase subunit delta n=1 Tax=Corynebacterium poyangense TaxID=2684405 RepID=A0A7H0SND0_9CORY|nr:F0F1 ATP synthase subunit delta [Corynebacterium poyangense]MBZ8177083.1 F0F1 ATP synthase subunit delta [Corynebacterium poyangense]QNQ90055.1 F0F1 ATP synthase subunit delta [Corynebacterium poyangense]